MPHKLTSTVFNVLDILNDCQIHQGSEIATSLGISRTAVWKIIQRLKRYHVQIDTKHRGYHLASPLILVHKKGIERALKDPGVSFDIFETLPSTSDYIRFQNSNIHKSVCISEHQSHGRGRLGRKWVSPFGCNVYCSFTYIFDKDISQISGLSLVIGVLTVRALKRINPDLELFLKWPNDIYLSEKKVGGVVIDIMAEVNGSCSAIIGIGLNVNMKDCELGIDNPWTSLEHVTDKKFDRNEIIGQLMTVLFQGLDVFAQKGMTTFLDDWKTYDFLENKYICVNKGKELASGIAKGIDPQGNLILEIPSGNIEKFSSGDAKILKE